MKTFLLLIILSQSIFADSGKSIYEKILGTRSLFKKQKLGLSLGKKGKSAEPFILKLLKDDNYWNRSAGVYASNHLNTGEINKAIFRAFLKDHMIRSDSKKTIINHFPRYEPLFLQDWKHVSIREKKDLLTLLAKTNSTEINILLKNEVSKKSSSLRVDAFKVLIENPYFKDDSYIRKQLEDKSLKSYVLEYIYQNGDSKDKKLMRYVLQNRNSTPREKVIALHGMKKWGSFSEQKNIFLSSIQPDNHSSVIIHSLYTFGEIRSEKIQKSLCNLSKNSKLQEIRILSAEKLIPYQDPSNLKCIKGIAREKYRYRSSKTNAGDVILGIMSLGLTSIFKSIKANRNKRKFYSRQSKVKEHIKLLELMEKENY